MKDCPNDFLFEHLEAREPALEVLREAMDLETLNDLAHRLDCPVRFCARATHNALDYERRICEEGLVYTRIHTWHDRLNAAMWILWPKSKMAISRGHLLAAAPGPRNRRRDALTLVDEVGVVIVAPAEIEILHRRHCWEELFWHAREDWFSSIHPLMLGHGLAEQCLSPYVGLTAKALYLDPQACGERGADQVLAQLLEDPQKLSAPKELLPFPLLGTPGWHPETNTLGFYRNHAYFRPRRSALSSPK